MAELGTVYVDVRGDWDGFQKQAESRGSAAAKGVAKAFVAAFAAAQVGEFIGDSIGAASDLNEAVNITGLVFGDARGEIDEFVKSAASGLGQSETAAREATAQFGGLLSNLGFAQDETVNWSQDLTTLSSDLASAFNTDPADAAMALGAALRGESEPLKRFNVFLDDATLKAKAVELGLAATASEVDRNGKAQAALAIISEQTSSIQGDFANTSEGLANRQRIVAAQMENVKAKIGSALLPAMEAAAGFVSNTLVPAFERVAPIVQGVVDFVSGLFNRFRGSTESNFGQVQAVVTSVFDAVRAAFEFTVGVITEFWERFGQHLVDFAVRQFGRLKAVVQEALDIIKGIFEFFTAILTGQWGAAWDALFEVVTSVWGLVQNLVSGAFDGLTTLFGAGLAALSQVWQAAWNGIKDFFGGVWDGIKETARSGVNAVIGLINGLIRAWNKLDFDIPGFSKTVFGQTIGFEGFTLGVPDISQIPMLAAGGAHRGLSIVGEAGPELLVGGSGTVLPNSTLRGMSKQVLQLVVDGRVLAEAVVDPMHESLLSKQKRDGALGLT